VVINSYLEKEMSQGLVIGPFSSNPLCKPVSLSPLNSVPKKDHLDRRIICDFSYPQGSSVNDGIPKNWYLGEFVDLSYPTVDHLASQLQRMGPGTCIYKKDLKRAYRQFRIDPGDIHLTGYMWESGVYIDLALVMGARSAAHLCQRVTEAVVFIARHRSLNIISYLDDFCGVVCEKDKNIHFSRFSQLLAELGLIEAVEKSVPPSTRVEFLGVLFDSDQQTMSITPSRLQEITELVDTWLSKRSATKQQLQSLIGKLSFVARCVFSSRLFLSRLINQLSKLQSQNHFFKINAQFRKDLLWWQACIAAFNGVSFIPDMGWSAPDLKMSTDACLTGIGGWVPGQFFSTPLPKSVLSCQYHINVLELWAIVIGIKLWHLELVNSRILVYCDNLATVTCINSGKSRDPNLLRLLRELSYLCIRLGMQVRAVHLPGHTNRLADKLSRAPTDPNMVLGTFIDPHWRRLMVSEKMFEIDNPW